MAGPGYPYQQPPPYPQSPYGHQHPGYHPAQMQQMRYGAPPQQVGRTPYGVQPVPMPMTQQPMHGMGRGMMPPGAVVMGQPMPVRAGVSPPPNTATPAAAPPVKKASRALTITDKSGNVIDLASGKTIPAADAVDGATAKMSSLQIAAKTSDAGAALRKAAEEAIAAGSAKKAKDEAIAKKREEDEAAEAARVKEEEERFEMEKVAQEEARKKEEEEREKLAQEEARQRVEAEERARKEFEDRQKKEAEEKAERIRLEEEARARLMKETEAAATATSVNQHPQSSVSDGDASAPPGFGNEPITPAATETAPTTTTPKFRPGGSLRPGSGMGLRPGSGRTSNATATPDVPSNGGTRPISNRAPLIYSKDMLLSLRDLDYCCCRPDDLPDMTINRGGGPGSGGNRGQDRRQSRGGSQRGVGDDWNRGASMPNNQVGRGGRGGGGRGGNQGGSEWNRGQAPPPRRDQGVRGGRGGRGANRQNSYPDDEGDYEPLVRSANRWKPAADTSAMVKIEKQVKGILNKMTKEKFDKLSDQMCDIPILSYNMLSMFIKLVYEKAIGEPYLSDMYANLCYRLAARVKKTTFVKIIESDEDPGQALGEEYIPDENASACYRWSNDVSTTDAEIVGPFETDEECIAVALDNENELDPMQRGDLELSLHRILIKRGTFIKIMHSRSTDKYYTVYFSVSQAEECGQQLSSKIFTSEIECQNDATKMNTFKRSLLNKCEDEFNKQDIYNGWKEEKKAYDKIKATLTEPERVSKEEDLEFRRMKIKKQMLGNVKFIGELYKLGMLKEKIMRFCIQSLMKLEEVENASYVQFKNAEDDDMDEEDHEALCNLFITVSRWFLLCSVYCIHLYISYLFPLSLFSDEPIHNNRLVKRSTTPKPNPTCRTTFKRFPP